MAISKQATIFSIPLASLCESQLNPTQWVFCFLLHSRKWDALTTYVEHLGGFPIPDLRDLGNRGFVTYINPDLPKKEVELANNLQVTAKFADLLYGTAPSGEPISDTSLMIDDEVAFNELFMAYPPFIDISGGKAPGRNISVELGAEQYSLITKGKRVAHEEILDLLQWGMLNGLVNMGLKKFLDSRQWLSIKQLRESGEAGGTFTNDI